MIKPLEAAQRTAIVDILRGWALLSVVLINFSLFFYLDRTMRVPADDTLSQALKLPVQVFFLTKGWTMLAFLFGYGFSVLIDRIKRSGRRPALYFSRRMFWLMIIALVNCAFYYGDVLKDYVIVGMIVLLFHRVSAKAALRLSLGCLLVFPALIAWSHHLELPNPVANPDIRLYQSHNLFEVLRFGLVSGARMSLSVTKYFDWNLVMLSCALAGLGIQRAGILEDLVRHKTLIKQVCLASLVFALAVAGLRALNGALDLDLDRFYDTRLWPLLGQMVFFMSIICWLHAAGRGRRLFDSMRQVGRMTLTNYMVQNLAGLLVFSGFGLGLLHRMPYSYHVLIGAAVFTAQVFFSRWWLSRFRLGPIEWLWRRLSNGPVVRAPAAEAA